MEASKFALILAFCQAGMPIIGWGIGTSVRKYIAPVDHWIAFVLLAGLGAKMIYESFLKKENKKIKDPLKIRVAFFLGLTTSIDALAIGFSMANLLSKILTAILIIGITTYFASMTGILIGKKTGPRINRYTELLGGIILLAIGIKILIEHLYAISC